MSDDTSPLSPSLLAAWRERDWSGGAELLRPLVERFPDVLATRAMLAALHVREGNAPLATLQYEKLLVLAVGQGNLFHALAAQRRLDQVRPAGSSHARRYQAIQQWFRSIPARRSRRGTPAGLTPPMVLQFSVADFTALGESLAVETLDFEPRTVETPDRLFEVMLWGRARWVLEPEGEPPLPAVTCEPGDTLCAPPGTRAGDRIVVTPELPSEALRFHPEFAARLRRAIQKEAEARRARLAPKALAVPKPIAPATDAGDEPAADRTRPAPDPEAEPTRATAFPRPRRHEHRVGVDFLRGAVRLGLAGSRVAPFQGSLVELSPAGIGAVFPGAALRQSRAELEGAMVVVYLRFPDLEEPVRLAARVTRLAYESAARDPGREIPRARLSMEFALLLAADRAAIQEGLINAARVGQWPGMEAEAEAA